MLGTRVRGGGVAIAAQTQNREIGRSGDRHKDLFGFRKSYSDPNHVVHDAAIAAAAKALGDDKLDRFVVRDPSQRYRLVFSEEGVQQLKQVQRNKGLRETGMLDSATLRVLRKDD